MIRRILYVLLTLLLIAQFFRPTMENPPADPANDMLVRTNAPADISALVRSACYDCHSDHTTYPWYSKITPVNFWLQHHVNEGREELNMSAWGEKTPKWRDHKKKESIEMLKKGDPITCLPKCEVVPDGAFAPVERANVRLFREERQYYWRFDDQRGWHSGFSDLLADLDGGLHVVTTPLQLPQNAFSGHLALEVLDRQVELTPIVVHDPQEAGGLPDAPQIRQALAHLQAPLGVAQGPAKHRNRPADDAVVAIALRELIAVGQGVRGVELAEVGVEGALVVDEVPGVADLVIDARYFGQAGIEAALEFGQVDRKSVV